MIVMRERVEKYYVDIDDAYRVSVFLQHLPREEADVEDLLRFAADIIRNDGVIEISHEVGGYGADVRGERYTLTTNDRREDCPAFSIDFRNLGALNYFLQATQAWSRGGYTRVEEED